MGIEEARNASPPPDNVRSADHREALDNQMRPIGELVEEAKRTVVSVRNNKPYSQISFKCDSVDGADGYEFEIQVKKGWRWKPFGRFYSATPYISLLAGLNTDTEVRCRVRACFVEAIIGE